MPKYVFSSMKFCGHSSLSISMMFGKKFDFCLFVTWEPQTPMLPSCCTRLNTIIVNRFASFCHGQWPMLKYRPVFYKWLNKSQPNGKNITNVTIFVLSKTLTNHGQRKALVTWIPFKMGQLRSRFLSDRPLKIWIQPRSYIADLYEPTWTWLTQQSGNRERKAQLVDMKGSYDVGMI